ncbi:MAG: ABC transporter substrate-binding protein [Sphaerochaetaceae bacterium]|nr:ABC transporter substrate-binding protein [Sphaerochaetaceae bacterium]
MKKSAIRFIVTFSAVCLMSFSLFAQGQGEKGDAVGENGRPLIRVGAMAYYLSVPLQVIQDEKLDEKYNFDLDIIDFPSGGPMAEALGAGEWDIGPIGAGGMVAIPRYNAMLIADIETTMDGAWILARPDSDIVKAGNTLNDYPNVIGDKKSIEGKTMLGTVGNISHYMGLDYLSKFDLGMEDVNFIHMETAQIYTAFVAGNGDLACLGSPSAAMKLVDQGYVRVGGLAQQDKSQQDAMLVSEDFYNNHYDTTVNFMKAWYEACDKLNADEDYEFEMVKKFYTNSGRTDFDDAGVRQECEFNKYNDSSTALNGEVGKWMKGLIQFYVDNGSMDKSVIEAMNTNIKKDVVRDALTK